MPAVWPATAKVASGRPFAIGATIAVRSVRSASYETVLSPVPAIESSTRATVWSGLTKTWKGSKRTPVVSASARARS